MAEPNKALSVEMAIVNKSLISVQAPLSTHIKKNAAKIVAPKMARRLQESQCRTDSCARVISKSAVSGLAFRVVKSARIVAGATGGSSLCVKRQTL